MKSSQPIDHVMLLSGNALCNNPRVEKEATTLANAGLHVTVLGAWLSQELKARDLPLLRDAPFSFEAVVEFNDARGMKRYSEIRARLRTGIARKLQGLFGIESRWQLGYPVEELLHRALHSDADLFIAHSEAGLYAARELRRRGRLVGADMEDWFSEDLTTEQRRARPVALLRALEQDVLCNAVHASCTSAAMSSALADRYGCPPPKVIYNAFPWESRNYMDGQFKDRSSDSRPSIHWYSQTLGPDRGLEALMAALPLMKADAQVHLRGRPSPGYREFLHGQLPAAYCPKVQFHDLVASPELLSRIAEHDIGFSGERSTIPSRDLTVTNKILHYLLAGLPAVASDTSGNREVAKRAPEAVFLWSEGNTMELASRIDSLLLESDHLTRAKSAALRAAKEVFCWERQTPALISSISAALAHHSA